MLCGTHFFCEHFLLYQGLYKFSCNYRFFSCLSHYSISEFLFHSSFMSLMHQRNMFLVDNFLCFLMNYWDMFLMNMLLVNDRLNVFMDDRSMVLMNQILMQFFDDILVMLMDYLSMSFFDDRLLYDGLNNWCFFMSHYLGSGNIGL